MQFFMMCSGSRLFSPVVHEDIYKSSIYDHVGDSVTELACCYMFVYTSREMLCSSMWIPCKPEEFIFSEFNVLIYLEWMIR